jgi:hypothetical protein
MLIRPLYKKYIFPVNHEVMCLLVATDKLSSQRIISQLLGGEKVLNILICSGVHEVSYNN